MRLFLSVYSIINRFIFILPCPLLAIAFKTPRSRAVYENMICLVNTEVCALSQRKVRDKCLQCSMSLVVHTCDQRWDDPTPSIPIPIPLTVVRFQFRFRFQFRIMSSIPIPIPCGSIPIPESRFRLNIQIQTLTPRIMIFLLITLQFLSILYVMAY